MILPRPIPGMVCYPNGNVEQNVELDLSAVTVYSSCQEQVA